MQTQRNPRAQNASAPLETVVGAPRQPEDHLQRSHPLTPIAFRDSRQFFERVKRSVWLSMGQSQSLDFCCTTRKNNEATVKGIACAKAAAAEARDNAKAECRMQPTDGDNFTPIKPISSPGVIADEITVEPASPITPFEIRDRAVSGLALRRVNSTARRGVQEGGVSEPAKPNASGRPERARAPRPTFASFGQTSPSSKTPSPQPAAALPQQPPAPPPPPEPPLRTMVTAMPIAGAPPPPPPLQEPRGQPLTSELVLVELDL